MFLLKTIVILLTVLHIIAAQCNSDQFTEFQCKDSRCKDGDVPGIVRNGVGRHKPTGKIVGFTNDEYLVKDNKELLFIVKKNNFKANFSKLNHIEYHFKVNIHKETYTICESSNQSNESPNDSNMAQTSKNVDTHLMSNITENAKFSEDEMTKNQNQNNETDSIQVSVKKGNADESIETKNSEDEPEDNTTETSLLTFSNSNDDLKETNQMNVAKSTNSQKFENDSSMECSLDSCDTYPIENITPSNENNLHQEQNNHKSSTQYDEKIESSKRDPGNNEQQKNNETDGLPDSGNNTDESNISIPNQQKDVQDLEGAETSQNDQKADKIKDPGNNEQQKNNETDGLPDSGNNTDESNISIPNQQKDVQDLEGAETSQNDQTADKIKDPGNNEQPQNNETDGLTDSGNNIDESNISIPNQQKDVQDLEGAETSQNDQTADKIKDPGNNEQPQNNETDGLTDSGNNTDESNISIPNQQKDVQDLEGAETSQNDQKTDKIKYPSNNEQPKNNEMDGLTDSGNNTDESNISIPNQQKDVQDPEGAETSQNDQKAEKIKDPGNNEQPQNNETDGLTDSDNNTDETNISIPIQQKNVELSTPKDEKTESLNEEFMNPQNSKINSMEEFNRTEKENRNNSSPQDVTEVDNQKDKNNLTLSKKDDVKNEFSKESENTHKDNFSIIEPTVSNNDSVSDDLTHPYSSHESTNKTENVDGESNVQEILNKKSIDECTQGSVCSHVMDSSTPNYSYKTNQQQYTPEIKNIIPDENLGKTIDSSIKEKSKHVESISIVASFGHPDTCSGVNCLRNKKNAFMPSHILNVVPKQVDLEDTSHLANTDFEKQNKYDISNEIITEKSNVESFSDHIINGLFSPTSNSLNFLWNMFGDYSNEYNDKYPDQSQENQKMLENKEQTNHSELYFLIADVVTILILVFLIFHYKYQKRTHANDLLTLLAAKDQYLLIIEKELSLLKEQRVGINTKSIETISEIVSLNEKLAKSEDIISTQEFRIEKLEQEVEELTESGMEMHSLLSSALESSSKNNDKYSALKEKLVNSQNLATALTKKNFSKTTELEKKNDIIKTLQATVDELTNKNIYLIEDNTRISFQKDQIVSKNQLRESKLLDEINNLQFELNKQTEALVTAENEVLLSKEALEETLSQKFNANDVKKNMSLVKFSAEIKSAKQIGESYKKKLDESLKSNQEYLDQIDDLKSNIVNLEEKCSQLKISNEESLSKLNILTTFFKEQEKEYLKQINDKAMLCDNKDEESSDLHERLISLNQEMANYKSEIQSLKKEIIDQEASFKIQISAETKKANDHWISFRQAERKLKEMELETAQLRNKLTMVDKKLENGARSVDSSKDFEDELLDIPLPIVSPDFTLLDFEPPPPIFSPTSLQHVSVDQRLPPLGALGQASSPPVPSSRRHNRSLSPGSPSPQQRSSLFRPLPQRHNYINRQNSLGHSTESLDK